METTIVVATEAEIKRLVKESVKEALETGKPKEVLVTNVSEALVNSAAVISELGISIGTLRIWRKLGLPAHKQNHKVYFLLSEVREYMTNKKPKKKFDWI